MKYNEKYIQNIIEPFIKNIDKNLNIYPDREIDRYEYYTAQFDKVTSVFTNYLIEGKLNNNNQISIANVDAKLGNETVFKGIFGTSDCKNLKTIIKIHSDKNSIKKFIGKGSNLEMDSTEFEEYFDIYAVDKIKAMQILTADVMQLLIEIRNKYNIEYDLTIRFNRIYIRFHTAAELKLNITKKSIDYDTLKRYYDIIELILKVILEINKTIENIEI